jgi:hypothetical protein
VQTNSASCIAATNKAKVENIVNYLEHFCIFLQEKIITCFHEIIFDEFSFFKL